MKDRLESIQSQFIAWLCWKFKLYNCPQQKTLSKDLKLENLSVRSTLHELILFYKVINGQIEVRNVPSMRANIYITRKFDIFCPTNCEISPIQRISKTANKYLLEIDFFCTKISEIKKVVSGTD